MRFRTRFYKFIDRIEATASNFHSFDDECNINEIGAKRQIGNFILTDSDSFIMKVTWKHDNEIITAIHTEYPRNKWMFSIYSDGVEVHSYDQLDNIIQVEFATSLYANHGLFIGDLISVFINTYGENPSSYILNDSIKNNDCEIDALKQFLKEYEGLSSEKVTKRIQQ